MMGSYGFDKPKWKEGKPMTIDLHDSLVEKLLAVVEGCRAQEVTVSANEEFKRFLRESSRHAPVIVDEAYLEYTPDFADRSAASLVRDGANIVRVDQCVAPFGLLSSVRTRTRSISASPSLRGWPGRASSSRPSGPTVA
jgi:hypothetical protein